jgi:hypothetical protein
MCLTFALAASAQELQLHQLVAEPLSNNLQIVATPKRYEAARQRPGQTSALPDPMFSAGFRSNDNPLPGSQLGSNSTPAIGFMVSRELPYPESVSFEVRFQQRMLRRNSSHIRRLT